MSWVTKCTYMRRMRRVQHSSDRDELTGHLNQASVVSLAAAQVLPRVPLPGS